MPLYEYTCADCGKKFEVLMREGVTPVCPSCRGERVEKQLSEVRSQLGRLHEKAEGLHGRMRELEERIKADLIEASGYEAEMDGFFRPDLCFRSCDFSFQMESLSQFQEDEYAILGFFQGLSHGRFHQ